MLSNSSWKKSNHRLHIREVACQINAVNSTTIPIFFLSFATLQLYYGLTCVDIPSKGDPNRDGDGNSTLYMSWYWRLITRNHFNWCTLFQRTWWPTLIVIKYFVINVVLMSKTNCVYYKGEICIFMFVVFGMEDQVKSVLCRWIKLKTTDYGSYKNDRQ